MVLRMGLGEVLKEPLVFNITRSLENLSKTVPVE